MGIKSLFGFGQARDKPVRNYSNGEYTFNFGRSTSGKSVNEMTAMQPTAVYAYTTAWYQGAGSAFESLCFHSGFKE